MPSLDARVRELATIEQSVPRQLVHGDFHLGQVLVAQTDAYLIDFEGEPLRDAEQRQAPDTIYKDLAGMLRSFDYAASVAASTAALAPTALDNYSNAPPADSPPSSSASRHDALLTRFRTLASDAFLSGYREARTDTVALSPDQEQSLLSLAQLEKSAYEVCYEAAHRPSWLPVPLTALIAMGHELLLSPTPRQDGISGGSA